MDKNNNVLDALAAAAREHTGGEVPEVAIACDAWESYCRNHSSVSFGSKLVKELDPELSKMVWDKIPTSTIAEAVTAYWAGNNITCPINNVHTEAALPYAIGRSRGKFGGLFRLLMSSEAIERKVIKHLREKATTNPTWFVLEYLPGAASASAVAELTSQELVNYLVLLHLSK